jgi:hypothetical protein
VSLRKCSACGNGVSSNAKACPHCGERQKKSVSGFTIALVCGIGAFAVWSSVRTSSTAPVATVAASAPASMQVITGDERKPIVQKLTKGLSANRDKMESITFYTAKNRNVLASGVDAYIALPDNKLPYLRMRSTFYGERWVFFDSVKIMADNAVIYERNFKRNDITRDNSGGSVWETADYYAENSDLAALKQIAGSKSATIRFAGRERRHDHTITAKERRDIRDAIAAHEELTRQLQAPASANTAAFR